MEQDGPGEPMTIEEAIRQRDEWQAKTATWQAECDKLNHRITVLEGQATAGRRLRAAAFDSLDDYDPDNLKIPSSACAAFDKAVSA